MKKSNKLNQGMTLVEVIIAMAVIGIIAVSMISLFTSAFVLISRAGDTSEALFKVHKEIETVLTNKSVDSTPTNIDLKFSSDGTIVTSKGNHLKVNITVNKSNVEISFFHPKY